MTLYRGWQTPSTYSAQPGRSGAIPCRYAPSPGAERFQVQLVFSDKVVHLRFFIAFNSPPVFLAGVGYDLREARKDIDLPTMRGTSQVHIVRESSISSSVRWRFASATARTTALHSWHSIRQSAPNYDVQTAVWCSEIRMSQEWSGFGLLFLELHNSRISRLTLHDRILDQLCNAICQVVAPQNRCGKCTSRFAPRQRRPDCW
jgi:hypothetical protein